MILRKKKKNMKFSELFENLSETKKKSVASALHFAEIYDNDLEFIIRLQKRINEIVESVKPKSNEPKKSIH